MFIASDNNKLVALIEELNNTYAKVPYANEEFIYSINLRRTDVDDRFMAQLHVHWLAFEKLVTQGTLKSSKHLSHTHLYFVPREQRLIEYTAICGYRELRQIISRNQNERLVRLAKQLLKEADMHGEEQEA